MKKEQNISTVEFDYAEHTRSEVIRACMQAAFNLNMPFAFWRLPHGNEIHFIASEKEATELDKVDFNTLNKGFLFSKFKSGADSNLFIQGDFHLSFDFDEVIEESTSEALNHFKTQIKEELATPRRHPEFYRTEPSKITPVDYQKLVEKAVEEIEKGYLEKVVPARAKDVNLSENFDVVELFMRLSNGYGNAFVSFVSIPKIGSWLGATPEVLIEKEGDIFRTVSLAGTKPFEESSPISETAWNQKEIEEQAMVSRYIINCFKKIRLRDFAEKGPKTARAGNLLHLKTTFEVNMKDTNFSELPTVMLELLHPTSAVAGMPKEPALDFLHKYEGLDRSFYSGFLGPVDIDDSTHVFVNLRCMELFHHSARLYAGAGVTEDSDAEKEYLETEMKCNTLLNKIIHRV